MCVLSSLGWIPTKSEKMQLRLAGKKPIIHKTNISIPYTPYISLKGRRKPERLPMVLETFKMSKFLEKVSPTVPDIVPSNHVRVGPTGRLPKFKKGLGAIKDFEYCWKCRAKSICRKRVYFIPCKSCCNRYVAYVKRFRKFGIK